MLVLPRALYYVHMCTCPFFKPVHEAACASVYQMSHQHLHQIPVRFFTVWGLSGLSSASQRHSGESCRYFWRRRSGNRKGLPMKNWSDISADMSEHASLQTRGEGKERWGMPCKEAEGVGSGQWIECVYVCVLRVKRGKKGKGGANRDHLRRGEFWQGEK